MYHSLHRGDWVNGWGFDVSFVDLLQDGVAWRHLADATFLLQLAVLSLKMSCS